MLVSTETPPAEHALQHIQLLFLQPRISPSLISPNLWLSHPFHLSPFALLLPHVAAYSDHLAAQEQQRQK